MYSMKPIQYMIQYMHRYYPHLCPHFWLDMVDWKVVISSLRIWSLLWFAILWNPHHFCIFSVDRPAFVLPSPLCMRLPKMKHDGNSNLERSQEWGARKCIHFVNSVEEFSSSSSFPPNFCIVSKEIALIIRYLSQTIRFVETRSCFAGKFSRFEEWTIMCIKHVYWHNYLKELMKCSPTLNRKLTFLICVKYGYS